MKTILIIEDDIVFSRSISNWLVKKGMKTECVATLANARKAIGRTSRIWLSTAGPFPMSLPPPSFSVIRREPLPVRKATRSDCSVPLTEGHCFWAR